MSGALRYALALLAAIAIGGAPAVARAALLAPATADVVLVTRIVRVSDGDTVHAMINGRAVRVRLSAIDAPEAGQAFGEKARRALADMVTGRDVELHRVGVDVHQRPLVVLSVEGVSVNAALVRLGWAWVFRQYSSDVELIALEDVARRNRWGLWGDPHPIPPWEFRRNARGR